MSSSLVEQIEIADSANKAKSNFLSNMSHEIRTPITAILGFNEMILREADDKGLVLKVDFDRDMPKLLNGDEIRIKQIITNILTNAIKYTNKGSIAFEMGYTRDDTDPDSVFINVAVQDTGIGIKKEDMEKLFAEFERIDEKRNRNIEGTGLGMNITKSLIEMMGSSLQVESEYGVRSRFSFSLKQKVVKWEPLGDYKKQFGAGFGDGGHYKSAFTAPNAHILMVDDNDMNLLVFKNLVKHTGHMSDSQCDIGSRGRVYQ